MHKKNDIVHNLFNLLNKKYKRSLNIYVILSISSFTLTAILVILNLFAVRFNPAKSESIFLSENVKRSLQIQQILFFTIIIVGSVSALVSGLMAEFTFRKKAKELSGKKAKINIEIEKYDNFEGEYSNKKERDNHLINITTKIINE